MNDVFEKLVYSKIEHFLFEYNNLSRSVFVDSSGTLIHPGEFGMYRERIVGELLKPYLPEKFAIGTGFIITHKNNRSTQCDLIIYDKESTPIIENGEQRFFPVECVVGVIEVKSKMSKDNLKKALVKLSNIKKLREDINPKNPYVKRKLSKIEFNPLINPYDQIATFLICESLEFNLSECKDEFFVDVYADKDKSLYHNMILSLQDGVYLYHDGERVSALAYYDFKVPAFKHVVLKPHLLGYKHEHIVAFVDYFYMLISSVSVLFIEMTEYLSSPRPKTIE